jgi:glycosyltransferase involved in cell wall biosynthesis
MRFVFVSTMSSSPWGGSEELWSQAALRLRSEGHQVAASVAWWPQLSPKVLHLARNGIELFMVSTAWTAFPRRAWHKLRQWLGAERPRFAWLRAQQPDLRVLSQGGPGDGCDWLRFCRSAGIPFVIILQSNHDSWWLPGELGREMAEAYRAARKVFFVSRHNWKLAERQIGFPLPNATVAWNPYNVPADRPPPWPPADRGWKLACVARLEPAAKGQDLLFEVLAQPKWRERNVEVNLYGGGWGEQAVKALAQRLQLSNVHFHGFVRDIAGIWARNHLLILPSRFEGLPLALLEAMWCGRPAVVTDAGGNAEVCADGLTGFVAAVPTVESLGQAMETAWERRQDWPAMGAAARARAGQIVPRDPVGDLCRQLTALAG